MKEKNTQIRNRLCALFITILLLCSGIPFSFAETSTESSFIVEYYTNLNKKEKKAYTAQIMEPGKRHTIQKEFPSVDYVNFLGWSFDKKAKEPEFNPGDEYPGDSSGKLYAVWGLPYDLGEISEPCTIEQDSLSVPDSVWFTFTVPKEGYYHFYTTDNIKKKGASSGTGIYYTKKAKGKPSIEKRVKYAETLVRDTDLTKDNIELLGNLSPKYTYYLGIYIPKGQKLVLQCEIIGN